MSRALQHKLALIADLVLPGYSSMDRAVDAPIAHAFMHWLVSRGRELSTGYQASIYAQQKSTHVLQACFIAPACALVSLPAKSTWC